MWSTEVPFAVIGANVYVCRHIFERVRGCGLGLCFFNTQQTSMNPTVREVICGDATARGAAFAIATGVGDSDFSCVPSLGLRTISAGIPYTLLLRFGSIGFSTFRLLLYPCRLTSFCALAKRLPCEMPSQVKHPCRSRQASKQPRCGPSR